MSGTSRSAADTSTRPTKPASARGGTRRHRVEPPCPRPAGGDNCRVANHREPAMRLPHLACTLLLAAGPAVAAEKDVFDHAAQKAAPKSVKKIVFVADTGAHGARGNH